MIEKNFPKVFSNKPQNHAPGNEYEMDVKPIFVEKEYINNGKRLKDKVSIITGGDSGIGRAVSIAYGREGCNVVIVYKEEDIDAEETKKLVEATGVKCTLFKGDISDENFIKEVVKKTIEEYGKVNILINNAAEQKVTNDLSDLNNELINNTFNTNILGPIKLTREVLPYLNFGDSIINTTSVTAYHGHETLLAYSTTKGALTSFTRSLALNLAKKGIRVNAVAPGPVWTPLIPSSFSGKDLIKFGDKTAFKRAAQPVEIAEAYVFLASQGASFITGETIHINGGEIVNS